MAGTSARSMIAGAVILFCLVLIIALLWRIHQLVFEVLALAALLLAFRHFPPTAAWFAAMPTPHRLVLALLFGAVLLGHLYHPNTQKHFPFVAWEIFSNSRTIDPVPCTQFIATTDSGKKVRLLVEQYFPSIVQFYPPDAASPVTDKLVSTLARAYNHRHPDDLARSIDFVLVTVKLHTADPPTCQPLKHYDVSSAR